MTVSVDHRHDLVVIGASAGGVQALQQVVGGLPADLRASVCIVLHRATGSTSALAQVLDRAGPLECRPAVDGEKLQLGVILVAPPDYHLVVEDDHVRLTVSPPERGHRPAVDALFRSAASTHDGRTVGVVLSGTLNDGSAGLAMITAGGGGAIVQDPENAMYAGMPRNAIASAEVDVVVPLEEIAERIVDMVNGSDRLTHADPLTHGDPRHTRATAC